MNISFRGTKRFLRYALAAATGKQNLHFLHIRKTGGTAIKNALLDHLILSNHILHTHPHRVKLSDVPGGHKLMFVVRDPVARFLSAFGSRLRQGAPAHQVPWTEDEAAYFKIFPTAQLLAQALHESHAEYEKAVCAMSVIGHVNSSYWDWFGDVDLLRAAEKRIFFIGRVESLNEDFAVLREALRLPENVQLPEDSIRSNRADGALQGGLSEASILAIKNWYRADYLFLDYCDAWRERHGGPVRL